MLPRPVLAWLRDAPYPAAALWLLAGNVAVFVLALAAGALVLRGSSARRVAPPAPPLERRELAYAAGAVVANTAVTLAGLWLYRRGVVRVRDALGPRVVLDVVVLIMAMDAAMYALHRLAHVRLWYRFVHAPHHRYEHPRPLTLFVLTPHEALGFGALWLALLCVYTPTWAGMVLYLVLNVAFGIVGHLGVEPLPRWWLRAPALRHVGTSTFHAGHHQDGAHNFGFYTVPWDRLFGTLAPRYAEAFDAPPAARTPAAGRDVAP